MAKKSEKGGPAVWLLRRCALCWSAPVIFLVLAPSLLQELRKEPGNGEEELDAVAILLGPVVLLVVASMGGLAASLMCGASSGLSTVAGVLQLVLQGLIICYYLGLSSEVGTRSNVALPAGPEPSQVAQEPVSESQGLPRAVLRPADNSISRASEPRPADEAKPAKFLEPRAAASADRISVVLPCLNEPYALNTVRSFCERTPQEVLEEIIVVDDASVPPIEQKLKDVDPRCRLKVLRHKQSLGLMIAKQTGGDAAAGKYIGFYDCHVAPAKFWYKETIDLLRAKTRRLVVPMIGDLNLDTWDEKEHGALTAKCYINFNADFWWYDDDSNFIPVISGGLVATTQAWWKESGGFDPGMRGWGGENTDQSLRAWLCGGDILRATSSRVAHMWRTDSDKRTLSKYHLNHHTDNLARVAAIWFGEFKEKFREGSLSSSIDVSAAKHKIEELQCKPFVYFLHRFRRIYVGGGMLPESVFRIRLRGTEQCINKGGGGYQLSKCTVATWFHLANMVPPGFPSSEDLHEQPSEDGSEVTCGGHLAPSCSQCPQGHGEEWCHMDCRWVFGFCLAKSQKLHRRPPVLGKDFSGIRQWNSLDCFDRLDANGPLPYFCDITGHNMNQQYLFDDSGIIRHFSGYCVKGALGKLTRGSCEDASRWEKIESFLPVETKEYKESVENHGLTEDLPDS